MTGSQAFFQVAVALIPALLFGGALAERRSAQDSPSPPFWLAILIGAALVAGVAAEVVAIRGAIDPSVSRFELRFLVFVVVAGTIGIAVWTAIPWVSKVVPPAKLAGPWRRRVGVVLLVTALVVAQVAITQSLDRADARKELTDTQKGDLKANRQINAAERGVTSARAALLSTGGHIALPFRHRLEAVLARHLEAMDQAVLPVLSEDADDAPKRTGEVAQSRIPAAFKKLNRLTLRLEKALEEGHPRVPSTDRRLVVLAVLRLRAAESERLVASVNALRAREQFEEACKQAQFLNCTISSD